jgi:chromosome segregation protein
MLIREIILENFMSYEYARIPLKKKVNLICGPNGSGKSSILIGISVALGQSYTERSKKLSDLIRRNKDIGRVTLVLDNSIRNGNRPFKRIRHDQIYLTRVLRNDGNYWFEIENVHASRAEVLRLLEKFDVDPDNMLIIMHQDMAHNFIILSPQEKLKLVEEAVGIEPYRRNVAEAHNKLSHILSQEESLAQMLESATQTLKYWREQYDRFQQKKQFILKRRFLERELKWAEVAKREEELFKLKASFNDKKEIYENLEKNFKFLIINRKNLQNEKRETQNLWNEIIEERILYEKEKAHYEFVVVDYNRTIKELQNFLDMGQERLKIFSDTTSLFENNLKELNLKELLPKLFEIKKALKSLKEWPEVLILKTEKLEKTIKNSIHKSNDLDIQLSKCKIKIKNISFKIEDLNEKVIKNRVDLAILEYRKNELKNELNKKKKESKNLEADLNLILIKANDLGARIVALRSPDEVLGDIRMIDGRISAMTDVSSEVENMYESYSKLYLELKEKTLIAKENRKKALEEIKTRMESWRNIIRNLLYKVSLKYQEILSKVGASGSIRLFNDNDIDTTGIEILVGFKGSEYVPLNVYSQSGGERSTAIMSFLLALQQHIKSPFRAIDEYDIHMDPKNREAIVNLLISTVKKGESQYLAITPNQIFSEGKNVHMIAVQNVGGYSLIRELS